MRRWFRQRLFSRQLIGYMLAFEFVFGQPAALMAQTPQSRYSNPNLPTPSQSPLTSPFIPNDTLNQLAKNDLNWQKFIEANAQTPAWDLPFNSADPAMDKDPFFLRGQNWQSLPKNNTTPSVQYQGEDLLFNKTTEGLEIGFSESKRLLHLHLPLTPIALTDEYVFLSLNEGSDLFQRAAGAGATPGEGIFFLERSALQAPPENKAPVPLFFFPLSGEGWTGSVDGLEMDGTDHLVLGSNAGEGVTIDLKDVESVMYSQKINLSLATLFSLRSAMIRDPQFAQRLAQQKEVLFPEAGSTAAFGLFFTGQTENFNLVSFKAQSQGQWQNIAMALWQQIGSSPLLTALLPQQALALNLPPDAAARITYILSILTAMLAVSVVIKYASPRIRNKLKRNRLKTERPLTPATTFTGKIKNAVRVAKREVREVGDVYAAMTTTSFQFPNITFGNALEIFLDRFAPSVAAADHTLVRRFLNKTYYFARDSVKRSPVSATTLVRGVLIGGGVVTSFYFLNYFYIIPWVAMAMAPHLSEAWDQRFHHTFTPQNAHNQNLGMADTLRKGVSAIQSGASSYASDSRQQIIEGITKDVDVEMRSMGKDPRAPSNQTLRHRMIENKADLLLQQRGLPGQDTFLFDAHSAYEFIPSALGYEAPHELAKEGFILAKRWGLTRNGLQRAINTLRSEALKNPTPEIRDAISILEETLQKMGLVTNAVLKGPAGFRAAKELRQDLTLLSYEGPTEYLVRHLPDTWISKYSETSARVAAVYFRLALFSYLDKEGTRLLEIPEKEVDQVEKMATDNVINSMMEQDPKLSGLKANEALKSITNEKLTEFKTRLHLEIQRLTRERFINESANAYSPPSKDWYAQRQILKTELQTEKRMRETLKPHRSPKGPHPEPATAVADYASDRYKLRRKIYAEEMAKQVGLHLNLSNLSDEEREQFEEMLAYVEEKAETATAGEIEHNIGLKTYLSKLSNYERRKIEFSMYGVNFLSAYKEASTERLMVDSLSPLQPGSFQKLRQKKLVVKSGFATRFLRSLEAMTDDQALELGVGPLLRRNIPIAQDAWSTHRRLLKKFLPHTTVIYAWNFFVWNIPMLYGSWLLMIASTAGGSDTPSQLLNRLFRLNGVKVFNSAISKIAFDVPVLLLTFVSPMILQIFSADVNALFYHYLRDPFLSMTASLSPEDWKEGWMFAGSAIVGYQVWNRIKESLDRYFFNMQFKNATTAKATTAPAPSQKSTARVADFPAPLRGGSVIRAKCPDALRRKSASY